MIKIKKNLSSYIKIKKNLSSYINVKIFIKIQTSDGIMKKENGKKTKTMNYKVENSFKIVN